MIAIVTGAGGGLGRAMSLGLLEAGHSIAAMEHPGGAGRLSDLMAAATAFGAQERLLGVTGDVTIPADCEAAVRATVSRFGDVDALMNNAGIDITPGRFFDTGAEPWKRTFEVNVHGAFLMALAAVPHLIAQRRGRIINVTTGYRVMIRGGASAYGSSKAALEAATAIWAADLEGTGVTVNVLSPGFAVDTAIVRDDDPRDRSTFLKPSVMVAPALWLVSEASAAYTGWRFTAKEWDPAAPTAENIRSAGEFAGWRGVGTLS